MWEVAQPYLNMSAREVFYGNENQKITFDAVMVKLGHPVSDRGCLRCYGDALRILKSNYKKEMAKRKAKTETVEYSLKEGIKFAVGQLGRAFQSGEMTQDEARQILKMKPELIVHFDSFPENWKEDCQK